MEINTISECIMVQCCPENHRNDKELYSYELSCGIHTIYYVLDEKSMCESNELDPIYLSKECIEELMISPKELYARALENTKLLLQTKILPLEIMLENNIKQLGRQEESSSYSNLIYIELADAIIRELRHKDKKEKCYILTNDFFLGGSICAFMKGILKMFCEIRGYTSLYVVIANADYAYVMEENVANYEIAVGLATQVNDLFKNDNKEMVSGDVFRYDTSSDEIQRVENC